MVPRLTFALAAIAAVMTASDASAFWHRRAQPVPAAPTPPAQYTPTQYTPTQYTPTQYTPAQYPVQYPVQCDTLTNTVVVTSTPDNTDSTDKTGKTDKTDSDPALAPFTGDVAEKKWQELLDAKLVEATDKEVWAAATPKDRKDIYDARMAAKKEEKKPEDKKGGG